MNTYRCLTHQEFTLNNYQLVPLRYEDIINIKNWRNDQIEVLRQQELLTDEMQETYYKEIIFPLFYAHQPQQILFSYLLNGVCIGYGGLVHLHWPAKRAEVSFLLETSRMKNYTQYEQDFIAYLKLIKRVAFEDLSFNRLHTETFDIREKHIAIMEKEGFEFEGRLKNHVLVGGKLIDSLIHGCLNPKKQSL